MSNSTLAPLKTRCADAGLSGVRQWDCETQTERADRFVALIAPEPQLGWPVHFKIVRQDYPQWAEVIDLRTGARGSVRFIDVAMRRVSDDLGVKTIPLIRGGHTVAILTWCVSGEWDSYQGPFATPYAALAACRTFWKRTLSKGT